LHAVKYFFFLNISEQLRNTTCIPAGMAEMLPGKKSTRMKPMLVDDMGQRTGSCECSCHTMLILLAKIHF